MHQSWHKTATLIASLFAFRMLGLFMLIPVFSIYATNLTSATPSLIGIALGTYGLSQGILQIPFGTLSDKYGRKPIILLGLILFAIGSLIGAYTNSIYGIIVARALQGAGAVGSVLIALLTDLIPEEKRTQSMAIVGSSIGISFSLAIVISPYICKHFGLAGIFAATTFLAIIGIIILLWFLPTIKNNQQKERSSIKQILTNRNLMQLNFGIFIQHFLLTSTFFALPMLLAEQMRAGNLGALWHFYLPIVLLGFLFMVPCIVFAERKKLVKSAFVTAVFVTLASQVLLTVQHNSFTFISIALLIYFIAFNFLEANLPSLVGKYAPANTRGTAMGVYSSNQFIGIFAGGSLAGIIFKWYGFNGVFILNSIISFAWLIVSKNMPSNK